MYKIILLPFVFVAMLGAELVNGVSAVVKGEAITLHDVKEEMRLSNTSATDARDILIRKKLEAAEIVERKISVNSTEVYEDIKKMAASNKMSIDQLYDKVRESNGLSSAEFKEKIKMISENAVGDACTGSNPRTIDPSTMERLFQCIYYGERVNF